MSKTVYAMPPNPPKLHMSIMWAATTTLVAIIGFTANYFVDIFPGYVNIAFVGMMTVSYTAIIAHMLSGICYSRITTWLDDRQIEVAIRQMEKHLNEKPAPRAKEPVRDLDAGLASDGQTLTTIPPAAPGTPPAAPRITADEITRLVQQELAAAEKASMEAGWKNG